MSSLYLLDIAGFLGHLHPLIVHLPIGFLLMAALLSAVALNPKYAHLRQAVSFCLLVGGISAGLSCLFGYLLSLTGDYDAEILSRHKLSGFVLTAVAGILYSISIPRSRRYITVPDRVFTFLLGGMALLVSYSGHQGGSLTHGNEYLNLAMLTRHPRVIPANADSALVFEDVIQPILEKKCGSCHQGSKLKGNLSIGNIEALLKGGKHGPAIVANSPDSSELFRRISLAPEDEKFMPSEGRRPLTKSETAMIRWWIVRAGAAKEKRLGAFADAAAIRPQVAAALGLGPAAAVGEDTSTGPLHPVNPAIPLTLPGALVDNLRRKGLMVRVMLQKPVMLDITLPSGSGKSMNEIREDLVKVAPHIVWLNVADNGFTDKDLAILSQMTNIERLRLERNPVTDSITTALGGLRHLEAVNLNETRISNKGLANLKKNPSLQRIYTWKTAVRP